MKKSLFAFLAFFLAFSPICLDAQKKANREKNKQFIEVYINDFWNKQNTDAFDTYYTGDLMVHFAEGNKVVEVWTATYTHSGDFMGIPATGKSVMQKGMKVYRIENGKIAELWFCKDDLGVLKQVGAIPPMGE